MTDFWSADRLFSDAEKLDKEIQSLEPYLMSVIQELSGITITQQGAVRLAGFWLLHFVHRVHALIHDELRDAGEIFLDCDNSYSIQIPHDRRQEMAILATDSKFRKKVDRLAFHVWENGSLPENLQIEKRVELFVPSTTKQLVKSSLNSIRQSLSEDARIWIAHPYLKLSQADLISSQVKSRKWARWLPQELTLSALEVTVNDGQRRELSRSVKVSNFSSLLRALLPLLLPFGYAEGLSRYRKQLMAQFPSPPKVLHSSIGLQVDHWYQVAASVWGERGTIVSTHQHGGHSGLDERHVLEDLEVRASDCYYTWGWASDNQWETPLHIPLPRASRKSLSRILLMSLESTEFVYRLQPFVIPSHTRACFLETHNFFEALNKSEKLVARCRAQDRDLLRLNEFNVAWEPLSGSGTKSASSSKLVLHNYFGTSWLETLAMNVPTVCFVPAGIHRFRAAAQPFIDALVRVGVVHYSGREAAKFVNSLRGDPSSWWGSSEVQEAREAFVARYANFSDNWLDAWQAEFESLLAE